MERSPSTQINPTKNLCITYPYIRFPTITNFSSRSFHLLLTASTIVMDMLSDHLLSVPFGKRRTRQPRVREIKIVNLGAFEDTNWHSHPPHGKRYSFPMDVRERSDLNMTWDKVSEPMSEKSFPRKRKGLGAYWGYFVKLMLLGVFCLCILAISMLPSKYMVISHLQV